MWCRWGVLCGHCLIGGDCRSWGLGQRCPEALCSGHQQRPEQWKRNFLACSSCCLPPFPPPSFPSSRPSPLPPSSPLFLLLLFSLLLPSSTFLSFPTSSCSPTFLTPLPVLPRSSLVSGNHGNHLPCLPSPHWLLLALSLGQDLFPQFSCTPRLEGVCRFSCTVELAECRVKPDQV